MEFLRGRDARRVVVNLVLLYDDPAAIRTRNNELSAEQLGLEVLLSDCVDSQSARIDASQDRDDLSEVNRRHGNGAA